MGFVSQCEKSLRCFRVSECEAPVDVCSSLWPEDEIYKITGYQCLIM